MVRSLPFLGAAALLAACASNSTAPSGIPADVVIVSGASVLTTTAFAPDTFTASVASHDTVTWANADNGTPAGPYGPGSPGITHHLVSDSAGVFDTGVMTPGTYSAHKFTTTGVFHYHCSIHPGMVGVIVVNS